MIVHHFIWVILYNNFIQSTAEQRQCPVVVPKCFFFFFFYLTFSRLVSMMCCFVVRAEGTGQSVLVNTDAASTARAVSSPLPVAEQLPPAD